jgi:hypothetical protein
MNAAPNLYSSLRALRHATAWLYYRASNYAGMRGNPVTLAQAALDCRVATLLAMTQTRVELL